MPAPVSSARPLVVFAYLGQTLDAGSTSPKRWLRWRPTVALGQFGDLLISRLELLYAPDQEQLLKTVQEDLGLVSPETVVVARPFDVSDPWALEEVYEALHDVLSTYPFKPEKEDYLVHITTGTHVFQICLFLLVESRHFPGRLLQLSPPKDEAELPGAWRVIDLDLSKYDRLAARFAREQAEGLSFLKAGIQTQNRGFNRLVEQLERVAGVSKAPILLLDEAVAHLDLGHRESAAARTRSFASSGGTVLSVVHELEYAVRHFERILVLFDGRLVADGSPTQILTSELLAQVFHVRAQVEVIRNEPHLLVEGQA